MRSALRRARCRGQRGVALAIVVWFIAGMALLVAGIIARSSADIRLAQAHLFRAQAEAAGDGAIRLLLADIIDRRDARPPPAPQGDFRIGEQEVTVVALPSTALIDLNRASAELLTRLFREYGGIAPGDAARLAAAVIEWRRRGGRPAAGPQRLDAAEDLLRVPGITRSLFDEVRHMVTVEDGGAPEAAVLAWAAAHAPQQRLAKGRGGVQPERRIDLPFRSTTYRVDALVSTGDQYWLRRHWISLAGGGGQGLPWISQRIEPARAVGVAR